jgi:hypothetical protein
MWLHNQLLFLMISPCLDNMCHHNCILNLPRTFTHLARSTKCSLTTPNHPSHNYKIIQKLKNITKETQAQAPQIRRHSVGKKEHTAGEKVDGYVICTKAVNRGEMAASNVPNHKMNPDGCRTSERNGIYSYSYYEGS